VTARGLPPDIHASVVSAGSHVWLVGEVDPGARRSGAFVATYRPSWHAWWVDRLSKVGGFFGATALGPKSVYAVGSTSQFVADGHPLIAHWNGTTWKVTTLTGITGGLTDVAAHNPHDVMAVGSALVPSPPTGAPYPGGLAVHWRGGAWHKVHLHHPQNKVFTAVAAGPRREYWAGIEGGPNHRATYLWFHSGKWSRTVGSKTSAATPAGGHAIGRQVTAVAHVPGTRRTLAVGYGIEADRDGFLFGPEALREMTTT
jgi:hypothetical protein